MLSLVSKSGRTEDPKCSGIWALFTTQLCLVLTVIIPTIYYLLFTPAYFQLMYILFLLLFYPPLSHPQINVVISTRMTAALPRGILKASWWVAGSMPAREEPVAMVTLPALPRLLFSCWCVAVVVLDCGWAMTEREQALLTLYPSSVLLHIHFPCFSYPLRNSSTYSILILCSSLVILLSSCVSPFPISLRL